MHNTRHCSLLGKNFSGHWGSRVRPCQMGDQDAREVVERKERSMLALPWCWMLELVAPFLSLKALLSLLWTITNLAPGCLIWVSCGIIIWCQSFWGITRMSWCFEAGKDVLQSLRIWPMLFLLNSRAIFKHYKSTEKKVLVLSLQGPLLLSLLPGHSWLLCLGSPSAAMFIWFSFSDSQSSPLSSFLYPIIIWFLPVFFSLCPWEGNIMDGGNGEATEVESSVNCFLVLPSMPNCYTTAATGYLPAYYL